MITLRKVPLAIAITAGILSAQAGAVDFKGYARSGMAGPAAAASSSASRPPVQMPNTVSVTNAKPTLKLN